MIIGLTGQLQVGKDTVADYLVESYGFEKVGYADALYECVSALFDIDRETIERFKVEEVECYFSRSKEWPKVTLTHPITMRQILQRMGTDVVRDIIGKDTWVRILVKKFIDNQNVDYVVKDVRFDNEANAIHQEDWNSFIWRIIRPGYIGDTHASEAGISNKYVNMEINNDGNIDKLYNAVDEIMEIVHGRKRVSKSSS